MPTTPKPGMCEQVEFFGQIQDKSNYLAHSEDIYIPSFSIFLLQTNDCDNSMIICEELPLYIPYWFQDFCPFIRGLIIEACRLGKFSVESHNIALFAAKLQGLASFWDFLCLNWILVGYW